MRPAWWGASAAVAVFLALGVAYSVVTPMWEAPDEVGHMAYVSHLARLRRLPIQREGAPPAKSTIRRCTISLLRFRLR
jgi:hypothetical protein